MSEVKLYLGDVSEQLRELDPESVQTIVTSPPYWALRDYGIPGQIGLESTPEEYVAKMVEVFREVWRVLRTDGTLWLNLGDSYAFNTKGSGGTSKKSLAGMRFSQVKTQPGLKPKNLCGIPWRVAFALQAEGWYLRSDIIWAKPNPMPESVTDRPTKSHEYIFLLSKAERYYYDAEAIVEYTATNSLTRNKRDVWTVATQPFPGAHFATFPPKLITPCILAGSKPGDTVLDPFNGAGTTGLVALCYGRNYIGIDINPEYLDMTRERLAEVQAQPNLLEVA